MKHFPTEGSTAATGTFWPTEGGPSRAAWMLAEEVPVGILLNSEPVAVMMATPCDLEALGIGFLVAEGRMPAGAATGVLVLPTETGLCVDVAAPGVAPGPAPRTLEGRSGCGLCGMTALTDVRRPAPHRVRPPLDPAAVARAFDALRDRQPMRAVNRSVHAAAFCDAEGEIVAVHEDVGRHTALDKLIGGLVLAGRDASEGFAVLSSRCSFELVQKSAIAGLGGLATLSAPTALALDVARDAGLPLAFRARDGIVTF